jgi:hypothetical protein
MSCPRERAIVVGDKGIIFNDKLPRFFTICNVFMIIALSQLPDIDEAFPPKLPYRLSQRSISD